MPESAIVVPAELIPSLELGDLSGSLTSLDGLSTTLDALATQASEIEVTNQEEYAKAGYILVDVKNIAKDAKNELAPFESIVNRVKTFLLQRRQKIDNRCTEINGILAQKMAAFSALEKAAAAQEQAKLNKGKQAPVTVEPSIPKVAGVRRHTNYYAEVTDQRAFLKEYIHSVLIFAEVRLTPSLKARIDAAMDKPVQREFITIDQQAIGKMARDMKDSKRLTEIYLGIKAWDREAF